MPRTISDEIRRFLAEQANHCCEYCHAPSFLALAVVTSFEIEHIIPKSKGGTDEEANLAFSCPRCNRLKSNRTEAIDLQTKSVVSLFHPRQQRWSEHFAHSEDGTQIIGLTSEGRATAQLLRFNDPSASRHKKFTTTYDVVDLAIHSERPWTAPAGLLNPAEILSHKTDSLFTPNSTIVIRTRRAWVTLGLYPPF